MTEPELERDLVDLCKQAAPAMNCYVEWIGQRKAKGSGTTVGAPDAILYCCGQVRPLEFKRWKDGRLSLGQIAAMEKRANQRVETVIVRSLQDFTAAVNSCRKPSRH